MRFFLLSNGIVLTESLAQKYFGRESALNQILKTSMFDGVVVGILEDFPENTHLDAYLMIPTQTASSEFEFLG